MWHERPAHEPIHEAKPNYSPLAMNQNPYTSPEADIKTSKAAPSKLMVFVAILAIICYTGLIQGIIATVVSMINAFSVLAETGDADPSQLSSAISLSLLPTLWGWAVSLIGFILILLCHWVWRLRTPWFFWWVVILSGVSILVFPLGTITGGITLALMLRNKSAYLEP